MFDEAHYLADEDRGHVWEEAIILTPSRIRMLLLSATVGNAGEFAKWIEELRGVRCGVVTRPGNRPVPLRAAFLMPDKRLIPLLGADRKSASGDRHDHRQRDESEGQEVVIGDASGSRPLGGTQHFSNDHNLSRGASRPVRLLTLTLNYECRKCRRRLCWRPLARNLLPAIVFLPTRRLRRSCGSRAQSPPFD